MLRRALTRDERGLALIAVLVMTILATGIGIAMVGLMNTDLTHAGVQHAKARSFYIAMAGLEDAKAQVFASANPVAYATSPGGVTASFGDGQYTYWVDAGPAAGGCGAGSGLKTLESTGQVGYLAFTISSRVRACGVPGAPFLTAMFGVSLVEAQGSTSRTYVAPYLVGTPGTPRGGHIGSFTEINFSDSGLRLNALSEQGIEYVMVRDPSGSGVISIEDYRLFGFTSRPIYETNPSVDPLPWILFAFGDIVKGQPNTGPLTNRCSPYTPYACVTTGNAPSPADITSIYELRYTDNMRHAYMNSMPQSVLPRLCNDPNLPNFCLDRDEYRTQAYNNTANAPLNTAAGLAAKTYPGAIYTPAEFTQVVNYLASNCPTQCLQGTVYIDTTLAGNCDAGNSAGCFQFNQNVNLGGNTGDVTLAVGGDLVMNGNIVVTNRHDLTTAAGRQTPGILVFGMPAPRRGSSNVCRGETSNGSGRLILCGGSGQILIADGMLFTADGMFIGAQGSLDLIGAMYHEHRDPSNPSYTNQNSTVVVRFDPLALSIFQSGIAIVSWQQLR